MANEPLNMPGMAAPAGELPAEGTPQMSEQEMRSDIDQQLAGLNVANNAVKSKQIASNNDLKNLKIELLKDILAALGNIGVDVTDMDSVKDFLTRLEAFDPDLFQLFEFAFASLSGEDLFGQAGETIPEASPAGMPQMGMPPSASAPVPTPAQPPRAQFGNIMGAMGAQQPPQQ
jgi:hypothetical protein